MRKGSAMIAQGLQLVIAVLCSVARETRTRDVYAVIILGRCCERERRDKYEERVNARA